MGSVTRNLHYSIHFFVVVIFVPSVCLLSKSQFSVGQHYNGKVRR